MVYKCKLVKIIFYDNDSQFIMLIYDRSNDDNIVKDGMFDGSNKMKKSNLNIKKYLL